MASETDSAFAQKSSNFCFFAKIAIFESTNVTKQLLQGDIETQEIDKDDNQRLNP